MEPSWKKYFKIRLESDHAGPCSHAKDFELHHENEEKSLNSRGVTTSVHFKKIPLVAVRLRSWGW